VVYCLEKVENVIQHVSSDLFFLRRMSQSNWVRHSSTRLQDATINFVVVCIQDAVYSRPHF